ncbi:hypothetical protein NKG05_03095 [Oerskovia sp. M15]
MTAARNVTGTAIPLELRGRLAGRLELLKAHLAEIAARPVDGSAPTDPTPHLAPWQDDRPGRVARSRTPALPGHQRALPGRRRPPDGRERGP